MVKANLTLYAIIPVKKLDTGKLRLSTILNTKGRREISLRMLQDVLKAVASAEEVDDAVVVSPDQDALNLAKETGFKPLKEEAQIGVNMAVKAANAFSLSRGASSTLVLPADIPLVQPRDIQEMVKASKPKASVVITPSTRMDGTNALLRRPPEIIQSAYDKESYRTHIRYAKEKNVHLTVIKSKTVMLDLDIPEDIAEFMAVKSDTETYRYLSRVKPTYTK